MTATPGAGLTVDLAVPERALAIGAHPDDVEFGCGATLAKWAAAGCAVSHLVCTDGSKGSWDATADVARLVATRQDEQRAAARCLGATGEPVFLGWPDGELECGLHQRAQVAYWIRRLRPVVVLGHDPWRRYRLHPDHRNAGFLTCDGIVAARDPHFFPEQGVEPWRPSTLLLWEAQVVDHAEGVDGYIDSKVAALFAHASQYRSTMHIDPATDRETDRDTEADVADAQAVDQRDRFRGRVIDELAAAGRSAGLVHAEVFKRLDDL